MKLNRNKLFVISILILAFLCVSTSAYSQEIYRWKVPTGSATGSYYPVLTGICMVLGLYTDNISATAAAGGGGSSNAIKVGTGEAPFSLTSSNIAYYATRGEQMFTESYPSIKAWGTLHKLYVAFFVETDSKIKDLNDLSGKKVAIGEPGSGDAIAAEDVLKAAGLWDLVVKVRVGDPQNFDLLKLGQVDAIIHHTSSPNPNFYSFSTTTPIRALNMPQDVIDKLVDLGYFDAGVIKAGTYVGHEEDSNIVVLPVLLIINEEIPEDVVYEMTKVTYTHFDEVIEVAPYVAADIDMDNLLKGIPMPLHPGAYKYFKEAGYEIPDRLKP